MWSLVGLVSHAPRRPTSSPLPACPERWARSESSSSRNPSRLLRCSKSWPAARPRRMQQRLVGMFALSAHCLCRLGARTCHRVECLLPRRPDVADMLEVRRGERDAAAASTAAARAGEQVEKGGAEAPRAAEERGTDGRGASRGHEQPRRRRAVDRRVGRVGRRGASGRGRVGRSSSAPHQAQTWT